MFRNPERLAALAARGSTRIAETPFAELLVAHEVARSTVILRARRGPVEKRLALERGVPIDCRSNLVHETLSRYLSEIGRIPEEVAVGALARSAERGVLVGQVLVEEGHLDSTELTRVLQMNLAKKLLDLFTWSDGEIERSEDSRPQSALKVKVSQLVLTGVGRFMPQAAIDRRLALLAPERLERDPEAAAKAADLRLSARDATVIEALDAPARLEELVERCGLAPPDAARSIYALLVDPVASQELRARRRLRREEATRTSRASFHRIETDLLDPAVQHRKGLALLEAGKLKAALEQLEFAADCDPQNGDYRAEAARCRYRLSPASEGRRALEALEEAQRIDPRSARARLYFGEIAGEAGRFDEAEASLRQAAKLLGPNDRRALDALHTLAALRRQKR